MEIVICAMAKNENDYINEWVEHYVKLGIDKIYLYDNNDFEVDNVMNHIDKKYHNYIVYKDIRGQHRPKLQHDIYTGFYIKYGKTFDWVFYCDIDEFLVGVVNFHSWFMQPQFKHAQQIRVMWKLFGDNDLIERDMTKSVMETFTQEVKHTLNRNLIDKGNLEIQGKAFVRGGMSNVVVRSPHFASFGTRDNVIPSILPSGRWCKSKVAIEEDYSHENVFLNHYMTKSLSEFVKQKLNRSDAVFGDIAIKLDYFWRINKKNPQKIQYLKDMGLE